MSLTFNHVTNSISSGTQILTIDNTGFIRVPSGSTAQRGTGVNGAIRYNNTMQKFEGYENGIWKEFTTGGIPEDAGLVYAIVFGG